MGWMDGWDLSQITTTIRAPLAVLTKFCAYDRKSTEDDNDDCNDDYDSNDGNFDENDDKNDQ